MQTLIMACLTPQPHDAKALVADIESGKTKKISISDSKYIALVSRPAGQLFGSLFMPTTIALSAAYHANAEASTETSEDDKFEGAFQNLSDMSSTISAKAQACPKCTVSYPS